MSEQHQNLDEWLNKDLFNFLNKLFVSKGKILEPEIFKVWKELMVEDIDNCFDCESPLNFDDFKYAFSKACRNESYGLHYSQIYEIAWENFKSRLRQKRYC